MNSQPPDASRDDSSSLDDSLVSGDSTSIAPSPVETCPTTIADRFSPAMNAATSRYGVWCDVSVVFVLVAVLGVLLAGLYTAFPSLPVVIAVVTLAIPVAISAYWHVALRNARGRVLDWVTTIPFEMQNLNGLLCGAGEEFEICFKEALPSRETVMVKLSSASTDSFVLEIDEESRVVRGRLGVLTRKFNPYGEAYHRFSRLQVVCEKALVPLHREYPIACVRFV